MKALFVALLVFAPALAAAPVYGPYEAVALRAVDGDTVEVDVAIWPGLTQRVHVRIEGVDTPELRGDSECERAAARAAQAFVAQAVSAGAVIISAVKADKYYGRVVAKLSTGGRDLGAMLIEAGHARPYDGGQRLPWCQQQ